VEFYNETDYDLNGKEFNDLVEFVLTRQQVDVRAECAISVVDLETITELHERWLNEPGPTDVMSFPIDEIRPGFDLSTLEHPVLGDIVLCPAYAQIQADEQGHSLEDELLLLTVHSVLHILGYDHQNAEQRKIMFDLQRQLLLEFLASQ
jgi:probable rRNA maturation factor